MKLKSLIRCLPVILLGGMLHSSDVNAEPSQTLRSVEIVQALKAKELKTTVINDFADNVVIPTYQQLVLRAETLSKAVDAFVSSPNNETLAVAQLAWRATRTPWEQSEAFAFGPAESLGYDGDLDDWPVNQTDVLAILKSKIALSPGVIENLQTTQKGFHTIEYLLFGLDNDKDATDFTPRELELLKLLADAFNQTAKDLTQSWVSGVKGNPPYRQVLVTAGNPQNPAYQTRQAAIEEIVQGIMGCLDEVGNEKIGEPLKTKETLGFESRFSHTSLDDFKNNILSVENAYLGRVAIARTQGNSLSDLIAAANPSLDKQVKQELKDAIAALEAVPDPVEPTLTDAEAIAMLTKAQTAVLTAFTTFEEDVLPLVQSMKR